MKDKQTNILCYLILSLRNITIYHYEWLGGWRNSRYSMLALHWDMLIQYLNFSRDILDSYDSTIFHIWIVWFLNK